MTGLSLATLLFVPANRPERYAKALASGADLVVIDLEDAVPADAKSAARAAALVAASADSRLAVRINPVASVEGIRDLAAMADARPPAVVLLPKVEHPAEVAVARAATGEGVMLVPLIETPLGLRHAAAIGQVAGVGAMMFGGGDFAAELGVDIAWEPLLPARGAFLIACAQAGVPGIDVPWIALDDEAGLIEEARRAKALGFAAKAAIHPAQVAPIASVMAPSATEIAEAREAADVFAAAGGAAVRFRGRMLEAPVMRRYARVLAFADGKEKGDA